MDTCAFCGRDPYHREDVGFGSPGVAVAVTCCDAGILAYGRGSLDQAMEFSAADIREIAAKIETLRWQVERRDRAIAYLLKRRKRLDPMQAAYRDMMVRGIGITHISHDDFFQKPK